MIKIDCQQCGKCCKWYDDTRRFYIALEDYERWSINEREDILCYVKRDEEGLMVGWYDPLTNLQVDLCPFLERISKDKYICSIHETKPKHCREYPLNEFQPEQIKCPGFNKKNRR